MPGFKGLKTYQKYAIVGLELSFCVAILLAGNMILRLGCEYIMTRL